MKLQPVRLHLHTCVCAQSGVKLNSTDASPPSAVLEENCSYYNWPLDVADVSNAQLTQDKSVNVKKKQNTDTNYKILFVHAKETRSDMETQMRQRVFTGVVTQMQEHHGIVDKEVHFPVSVVVGRVPLVGEKVLVKAVQDPMKPVGWTAQRVQTLNGQPFKSPPPLLPSMSSNLKPGILGTKPQPLLKSPKIPPLIPSMQPNPGGMIQMAHHQQMPWSGPFDGWGGGRKRHAEVMGGRRGGRWEDGGGGMWGGDAMHQKRKRWKAVSDEDVSKKTSSITTQNTPLFSCFSRDTQACDCLELQRRYPHLQVPLNLIHIQLTWTESFPLTQPLSLTGPCLFHVGSQQPETETAVCESTDSAFAVKVLLLSMSCVEHFYSQCCNISKDGQTLKEAVHPTTLLKFMLVDSGGELQLPGGSWSLKLDGSNPLKDSSTLVNTAVRCIKNQTALDLSACTQWHKMAEFRYLSGEKTETVVVLLPDVWNLVPTEEEWTKSRQQQQDDESLPESLSLVFHPYAGLNLSVVSLSSLLEPQSPQTRDSYEVCLMAEMFSEMLQRDFGFQLYQCLCRLPQGPSDPLTSDTEDNSTTPDDEPKKSDKKQQSKKKVSTDVKKRKLKEKDEERDTDEIPTQKQSEKDSKSQSAGGDGQTSSVSDNQLIKNNERPPGWTAELPRKVLLSWVFFDRQLTGSLREPDLLNILLSLGLYLSPAQAQDLVKKTTVGGLCLYRNLCSRYTDTDQTDSSVTVEGNKALFSGPSCKERNSARHSSASSNPDLVNYKGNVINIPNLLESLDSCKATQRELEKCIATLQSRLEAAEAKQASEQQEQNQHKELKKKLEKAETFNKIYEKSLRENASQMTSVIETMQKMVEQTTVLANTKEVKDEKV
ncbi:cell cycle and apoptosis regulator protein 2-like isoform X2 [Myxocyprinus asiaticus]|uniref:cell cycle and apoptosis regulator protein 2-like isoform X2 n=1 Tax=Myxocyprinus asiaticus TaxID=70543 RepID=UPI0022221279|nr:cell cycle and apoptosis regulator protein 2-like isoform X2 [Myxocyprinus asiaticus]